MAGKSEGQQDAAAPLAERQAPSTHLIQHRAALRPLPLTQEDQARDDVRWDDVKVSEKLREKVGDLRVGVLRNPGEKD